MTMPVLNTIDRRGTVPTTPCMIPPSGSCVRISQSPMTRARSTRSPRFSRLRAYSSSVPST